MFFGGKAIKNVKGGNTLEPVKQKQNTARATRKEKNNIEYIENSENIELELKIDGKNIKDNLLPQQIIEQRTEGFDLNPHRSTNKQLSSAKMEEKYYKAFEEYNGL